MPIRPEFIFKIVKVYPNCVWIWKCFTSTGLYRGESREYKKKIGAVQAARNFIKFMLPGVAELNNDWKEKPGNKGKAL